MKGQEFVKTVVCAAARAEVPDKEKIREAVVTQKADIVVPMVRPRHMVIRRVVFASLAFVLIGVVGLSTMFLSGRDDGVGGPPEVVAPPPDNAPPVQQLTEDELLIQDFLRQFVSIHDFSPYPELTWLEWVEHLFGGTDLFEMYPQLNWQIHPSNIYSIGGAHYREDQTLPFYFRRPEIAPYFIMFPYPLLPFLGPFDMFAESFYLIDLEGNGIPAVVVHFDEPAFDRESSTRLLFRYVNGVFTREELPYGSAFYIDPQGRVVMSKTMAVRGERDGSRAWISENPVLMQDFYYVAFDGGEMVLTPTARPTERRWTADEGVEYLNLTPMPHLVELQEQITANIRAYFTNRPPSNVVVTLPEWAEEQDGEDEVPPTQITPSTPDVTPTAPAPDVAPVPWWNTFTFPARPSVPSNLGVLVHDFLAEEWISSFQNGYGTAVRRNGAQTLLVTYADLGEAENRSFDAGLGRRLFEGANVTGDQYYVHLDLEFIGESANAWIGFWHRYGGGGQGSPVWWSSANNTGQNRFSGIINLDFFTDWIGLSDANYFVNYAGVSFNSSGAMLINHFALYRVAE
ncbi:MAG: hypothetical protein FWE06_04935 [Oscillospiraceae bacterium]|nr:hypothetical protein [Oscillospiraceae bacterium]